MVQAPHSIERPYLADGYGGYIYKNGRKVETRVYYFTNANNEKILLQEHSYGRMKATPQHGAVPHFNLRPSRNPTTGSLEGLMDITIFRSCSDEHYRMHR
jgi:hypothetical protein